MARFKLMRRPHEFLLHERWIACVYTEGAWQRGGWSLRHACGKYEKLDLEPMKVYQGTWSSTQVWHPLHVIALNKVPTMFGNLMRRKKRRNPQGTCPRCGEKIPGGLAIWLTTKALRSSNASQN